MCCGRGLGQSRGKAFGRRVPFDTFLVSRSVLSGEEREREREDTGGVEASTPCH